MIFFQSIGNSIGNPMCLVNRQSDGLLFQNADMEQTPPNLPTYGERLKYARKLARMTQGVLAKRAGMSQSSVSELENGQYPTSSFTAQLADALNVSAVWLAENRGPMKPSLLRLEASLDGTVIKGGQIAVAPVLAWEHPHDLPDGEYWFVPRMEVHLSAGNGHPTPEVVTTKEQPQAFRADWLRRAKLSPAKLACMYARGDSMEPRIFDGDALLVELGETTIVDSKLYAIWYAGELRVKRLYKRPDGGLSIQSYNAANYPPIEVPADQLEHVSVIGRVRQIQTVGDL